MALASDQGCPIIIDLDFSCWDLAFLLDAMWSSRRIFPPSGVACGAVMRQSRRYPNGRPVKQAAARERPQKCI